MKDAAASAAQGGGTAIRHFEHRNMCFGLARLLDKEVGCCGGKSRLSAPASQ